MSKIIESIIFWEIENNKSQIRQNTNHFNKGTSGADMIKRK